MKLLGPKAKDNIFYYVLMIPALLIIGLLTVYPIIDIVILSFQKFNYIQDTVPHFVGLGNFKQVLGDPLFRKSFLNTLTFCVVSTFFEVTLGVLLALIFQQNFKGKRTFMTVAILPMLLSTMVICAIWRNLFHYDIGLINHILSSMGMARVGWLTTKEHALMSIALVDIWQWTPFCFILTQAAISSIDPSIYEAAKIDGCTYLRLTRSITLPLLAPQIFLLIMLRTIDTFKLYGKVYALTGGGPGDATETLSFYIYRQGFSFYNMGLASAASILSLIIVAIISVAYIRKIMGGEQ